MYFEVFAGISWGKRSAQIAKGVFWKMPKNKNRESWRSSNIHGKRQNCSAQNDSTPQKCDSPADILRRPSNQTRGRTGNFGGVPFPFAPAPSRANEGTDVNRTSIDSLIFCYAQSIPRTCVSVNRTVIRNISIIPWFFVHYAAFCWSSRSDSLAAEPRNSPVASTRGRQI